MPRESKKVKKEKNILTWLVIMIISLVFMFFIITKINKFGSILNNVLNYLFGSLFIAPLFSLFFFGGYKVFFSRYKHMSLKVKLGLVLANITLLILSAYLTTEQIYDFKGLTDFIVQNGKRLGDIETSIPFNGGIVGNFLYLLLLLAFQKEGVLVIIIALVLLSIIMIIPFSAYKVIWQDFKDARQEAKKEKEELQAKLAKEKAFKEAQRKAKLAQDMANLAKEEEEYKEKKNENKASKINNKSYLIDLTEKELEADEVENKPTQILQVQRNNGTYKLPYPYEQFLEKVSNSSNSINKSSANLKGQKVIEILDNFGIEAKLINTYIGPSVTKFEIKPDSSVKVNKINNISDNIKMELAAKDIRIEAPIPGRNAVGIEIPNVEPIPVKMLDIIKSIPKDKKDVPLLFGVGKDLMGKAVYCDIAKMPHLLIAGATGSGKSVCINSIVTSLLLRTNPDEVKLVLVDPKKVEFTPYKDVPHLLWPIIDDSQMAANMLKKLVVIMEERYEAFAQLGVRNIKSFNETVQINNDNLKEGEAKMSLLPYIVVIIDELADLMMIAGKDVELSIQRITQLARASGIHLIVATQRPSTDVITGLIKSNIPSRISFAVASSIDSRTILDATGAERLLGNGDMLYHPQGENAPMRIQGVYVTDNEINKITSYVKSQAKPQYEDSYFEFMTNMSGTTVMKAGSVNADSMDSLYDEAVEYIKGAQKASTSLLQRRFGIGYNRAARLIDTLQDRGIIGPANGSKAREVYIKNDDE